MCLIIDEQERDKDRFLQLADQWGIDAQVRSLPAGDYIWILTPPLQGPDVKYDQRQPSLEKVLGIFKIQEQLFLINFIGSNIDVLPILEMNLINFSQILWEIN